jgi:hypothetical protein
MKKIDKNDFFLFNKKNMSIYIPAKTLVGNTQLDINQLKDRVDVMEKKVDGQQRVVLQSGDDIVCKSVSRMFDADFLAIEPNKDAAVCIGTEHTSSDRHTLGVWGVIECIKGGLQADTLNGHDGKGLALEYRPTPKVVIGEKDKVNATHQSLEVNGSAYLTGGLHADYVWSTTPSLGLQMDTQTPNVIIGHPASLKDNEALTVKGRGTFAVPLPISPKNLPILFMKPAILSAEKRKFFYFSFFFFNKK